KSTNVYWHAVMVVVASFSRNSSPCRPGNEKRTCNEIGSPTATLLPLLIAMPDSQSGGNGAKRLFSTTDELFDDSIRAAGARIHAPPDVTCLHAPAANCGLINKNLLPVN